MKLIIIKNIILVSTYFLFPLIDPLLLPMNVATRPLMGSSKGIYYVKKYINKMKENHEKIYVLKCDISKYFYSIDQEILINKLTKLIKDERIFNMLMKKFKGQLKVRLNELKN